MTRLTRSVSIGIIASAVAVSSLTSCGLAAKSNANDAVLQHIAQESCEQADGLPNLGTLRSWQHHVTGSLDPEFTDVGTVYLEFEGLPQQGTYNFKCSGRFDDNHQFATSVLDDFRQAAN
ncbi:hypothetical protein [Antrihabitans cavernicola]|uniref:Lipoprotein n=1 Tax=Antrihabitans cavernicola TaxID=2495913 RepID=A0A5A7S5S8_9NOCA|nr:hypothetical protein [Spelaeibacter cavernicola]KAA0018532.1 hypothetical protein FOY51_23940 [Spelaeibacter cavernicola]